MLVIVNNAAVNMGLKLLFEILISICLGKYPEVGLLVLFLIFWRTLMFSIMVLSIYIPTSNVPGFPLLHILTNICYLLFFKIIAILVGVR